MTSKEVRVLNRPMSEAVTVSGADSSQSIFEVKSSWKAHSRRGPEVVPPMSLSLRAAMYRS